MGFHAHEHHLFKTGESQEAFMSETRVIEKIFFALELLLFFGGVFTALLKNGAGSK